MKNKNMPKIIVSSTNSNDEIETIHITYPLENYEIEVLVDSNNRFLGINGIKIIKKFCESNIDNVNNNCVNELLNKLIYNTTIIDEDDFDN